VKNIREETEPIAEVVVGAVFKVHRASRPTLLESGSSTSFALFAPWR
jgi:hypothetical protein